MSTSLVILFILQNTVIQAVRVTGGNVTVVQGDTAVFPCLLTESTEILKQITWQSPRSLNGNPNIVTISSTNSPQFLNGYGERFSFVGNFSQQNGSLQLSKVTMSDEGTYTCIYTLYPSGNVQTEIRLNVLVPPKTSIKDHFLTVGNEEVALATCTAARSRPPADVGWHLGELFDLRTTHNSTKNADGTTTTMSTLFGAPTRNLHNHSIQCVIKAPALPDETTLRLTIQIHFPPSEVSINEISQNSFECVSEANPKANFTWSRTGLSWPDSRVKVNGAVLQIIKSSPQLNGLFECKATNTYGVKRAQLYLHTISEGACTLCWTFWSLFIIFIVGVGVGAAMWFYRSNKKCAIPCINTGTTQESQEPTPLSDAHPDELQCLRSESGPESTE